MPADNQIAQTEAAQDDWLADTAEDVEKEMFSEGDQANIDALLAADTLTAAPAAAKLAANMPESVDEEMVGPLAQDDIDALLGLGSAPAPAPAATSPSSSADEEMVGPLNQDDIDALLGGGQPPAPTAAAARFSSSADEEMVGPLAQDDIDALFGGGAQTPAPKAADLVDESAHEGIHVIDQAHLDALLNSDSNSEISVGINQLIKGGSAPPPASGVPSQEEMDKIFFEAMASEKEKEKNKSDDDLFLDEMMGEEAPSLSSGMQAFGLDEGDFKFDDDTPEIPAETAKEKRSAVKQKRAEVAAVPPDIPAEKKVKPAAFLSAIPVWLHNIHASRAIRTGVFFSLLLILGTGLYYGLWPRIEPLLKTAFQEKPLIQSPVAVVPPAPPPVPPHTEAVHAKQATKEPPTHPNRAPQVKGGDYKIAENNLGVLIRMSGQDEDGDALTYQITGKPRFGVLYGEAPAITYVAGMGFPGQDMFEFHVNDGHATSGSAIIRISGPDLTRLAGRQQPEARQVVRTIPRFQTATVTPLPPEILTEEAPQSPPVIQAVALRRGDREHIYTLNTEPVVIDWAELWQAATSKSFDSNVHVDIEGTDIHGQLEKLGASRSRYTPEPFFIGEETIRYRFTVGKKRSKIRQLYLSIANGNPYPRIHIKPLEKELYAVGETVELDASATRDDNRQTLGFAWEQTAGPLIKFQKVNGEGSVVRFITPAVFSNQKDPGLILRVIAQDSSGQISRQEVRITIQSRRHSPLWGQVLAANGLNQQLACPGGDCSALRLFR